MPRVTTISGEEVQCDAPDWTPLESLLGTELCGWFMWMVEVKLASGTHLHVYKHHTTRRHIHLAADARHAFLYADNDRYEEVDLAYAVDAAFFGWERAEPSPDDLKALGAALERARQWAA